MYYYWIKILSIFTFWLMLQVTEIRMFNKQVCDFGEFS